MSETNASRAAAASRPSADEWRRLQPAIDALLDAAPDRRAMLLAELSGGNASRRNELERLVAECERAYPLIEGPVAERFTALFGEERLTLPESLAGRYQIHREVGRGGMAVVYVARDLKHGRDVAVKVVRPELAAALGRARFLREIEIAARLRHPHIVPLYDSGELPAEDTGSSILYYVMPYEAGHSLRERLTQRGPLPIDDVMHVLRDVCDALAHAHQHGIVHRDIKPDNVLLSGRHAMVTDFGVARAVNEATTDASIAPGRFGFGTPTYMAPEQAANDPHVDHRADIYAIGVLAYELLTGQLPFAADERQPPQPAHVPDVATVLASRRSDVPEALSRVIATCLAQRPGDRWQSAEELLTQLSIATGPPRRMATRTVVAVALGAALLAAAVALQLRDRAVDRTPLLGRATQLTSEPGLELQPSMSPDGRHVAYAAGHSLQMRIAVRPVAGGRPTWLTADTTENQWLPRWSPDGARILFLARGGVFSAPAFGGAARHEIPSRPGAIVTSAAWSGDGREIAYVRSDSLLARNIASGTVRLIATGTDLHSCTWSRDATRLACVSGNSFYMTAGAISGLGPMFGNLAPSKIVVIPAAGGRLLSVTDSASLHQSPAWSRDGRMLYYVSNRQGPRDIYALDARTTARREPVRITTGMGAHSIDFSPDGTRIVYGVYRTTANVWAMPIPRDPPASSASAVPVTTGTQTIEGVRVSADGRWLIYDSDLRGNSDVYRAPVTGGDAERLTQGAFDEFRGVLSPSGRELAYHAFQSGSRQTFLLPLDGGPAQQLTRPPGQRSMPAWSPDGRALALFDLSTSQVFIMRRDHGGRWNAPRFIGGNGVRPEWSPDGHTIAFVSPQDGRIGIAPADSGAQRDLYVPRGGDPLAELAIFAPSGRELYFKSHDAHGRASFWSIPVGGGRPRLLARFDDLARTSNRFEFASDGTRFYFTMEDRQSDIWLAEVARR